MNFSKAVKSLLFIFFISAGTLSAQQMQMPQIQPADSVSDSELEQFVDVAIDLQDIRFEADSIIIGRLEEEGMSTERFQQIMMAQQNPTQSVELTTDEEETVANMQTFLQEVSMKAQQQQIQTLQNSELSPQRFQSIAAALQQDQDLAVRFQQMATEMESESGN